MTWLEFIVASLVTYRLSLMVTKEDGPYWIFAKIRKLPPPKSSTRQGLQCQLCVSMYSGSLVATYFWWQGKLSGWDSLLYALAFSAASIIIHLHTSTEV